MAVPQSSQTAVAASSIEKLHPEILELILLETVDNVTPPIGRDQKGGKFYRWEQELKTRESLAVSNLAIRLVSRKFRHMA